MALKKNLFYNCCPLEYSDEEWRDNVRMLCRYADIFNGRRIVVIKTREGLAHPDRVSDLFKWHGVGDIEFRHAPNDPVLHEVAGFIEALEELSSLDPGEATFYAHTKGVRVSDPGLIRQVSIRQWRNRMYHECLHDSDKIDALLRDYDAAGCFLRKEVDPKREPWTRWMFCGAFFWFNHEALFSQENWRFIGPEPDRFAPENYLGAHIEKERAYQLYGKGFHVDFYNVGEVVLQCSQCKHTYRQSVRKRVKRCCGWGVRPSPLYYPQLGDFGA